LGNLQNFICNLLLLLNDWLALMIIESSIGANAFPTLIVVFAFFSYVLSFGRGPCKHSDAQIS